MTFRIFVNHDKGRVLVSGKESDLELLYQGWELAGTYSTWKEAYKEGRKLADELDYVLEWYIEEELSDSKDRAGFGRSSCRLLLSLN